MPHSRVSEPFLASKCVLSRTVLATLRNVSSVRTAVPCSHSPSIRITTLKLTVYKNQHHPQQTASGPARAIEWFVPTHSPNSPRRPRARTTQSRATRCPTTSPGRAHAPAAAWSKDAFVTRLGLAAHSPGECEVSHPSPAAWSKDALVRGVPTPYTPANRVPSLALRDRHSPGAWRAPARGVRSASTPGRSAPSSVGGIHPKKRESSQNRRGSAASRLRRAARAAAYSFNRSFARSAKP